MFRNYDFKRYDFFLIILVIALVVIGVFAIGSATLVNIENGTDIFIKKQIIGFIVGFILMIVISIIDYHFIAKFYWLIYLVNIVLLLAVLLFGKPINGATRWINLGPLTLQSSEFCKIFMIIFLAKLIDKYYPKLNKPWFLLAIIALISLPIYLIYKEPDLSTSTVIIVILGSILFVGGLSYKYVIGATAVLTPAFFISFWYIQQPTQKLLEPYQVQRILSLIQPEKATASALLQTKNSIHAIGSGQLLGKGLYLGKLNKYNYLPEPQTDFIFSIIGEELGFIGCSVILVLLLLLIIKCIWIAKDTKDKTGLLIITGVVILIAYQTFVNVGVVTGILPNTGIPLPFISYGLSSLWTLMIGIGLILNISMQRKSIY